MKLKQAAIIIIVIGNLSSVFFTTFFRKLNCVLLIWSLHWAS